jgi:hypothetical protein
MLAYLGEKWISEQKYETKEDATVAARDWAIRNSVKTPQEMTQ